MLHTVAQDPVWEPIPGALDTALLAFERRPGILHCNTYLLKTPDYALVVDPGADAAHAAHIGALVRGLTRELPRQVAICLTHCHLDHCSTVDAVASACHPESIILCHKHGADALRDHDPDATLQTLTGLDFPRAADCHALFAGCGGVARAMDTPGGGLRSLSIPIGPRDALQVYHTPGHSPDSVCYRVGGALFAGDLPFAAGPGIVPLPGWDGDELAASVTKVLWLLDHCNITTVYAGHGRALDRTEARRALGHILDDLAARPGAATATTDFPGAQLSACGALLARTEPDGDSLDDVAQQAQDIQRAFLDRPEHPDHHQRAARMALRLDALLQDPATVTGLRLLRRARRRLGDFLCSLHGFRFHSHAGRVELNHTIGALTAEVAELPGFANTRLIFSHALSAPQAVMDAEVLADLVETVLEYFAAHGADRAQTAVLPDSGRIIVRVTHPGDAVALPPETERYLRLSMEAYGGTFSAAPGQCDFSMPLPALEEQEEIAS